MPICPSVSSKLEVAKNEVRGMKKYRPIVFLLCLWIIVTFIMHLKHPAFAVSENANGYRLLGRLIAKALWQQSEIFRDTGRWWMVLPLLRITTFLDPSFAEAFDFAGWHIAYNLRAEEKDEQQRFQWVKLGIQVYEQGLERSPNNFSLLFGLGWTAYDKLGDTVLAAYYLERALNAPGKFTKDIDWVRHMLAHTYERMPNIRLALKHWEEAALDAPYNPVARGATVTISERYTAAEAMSQNGYYEEAIQLMENILRHPDKKFATIPRHMLAEIYREMGDLESAYAIMKQMTEWHKLEPRAEFKARELEEEMKKRQMRIRE